MTDQALPLVKEIAAIGIPSALDAFSHLPGLVALESALGRGPVGRYSFVTADPVQWEEAGRVAFGEDPLQVIRNGIVEWTTTMRNDLPPFQGGWIGLLSYEAGTAWERVPRSEVDEFRLPDVAAGLYDWVLARDEGANRCWLISQGLPEVTEGDRRRRAAERIRQIEMLLENRGPNVAMNGTDRAGRLSIEAPQYPLEHAVDVTSDFSQEGYVRVVGRAIESIRAGEIFQANLSQRLLVPQRSDPVALYRRLRTVNPAPFAGLLCHNNWSIVSASPERFLQVDSRGRVETRPIKGTLRRAAGVEADLFSRDALRASIKDRAENVMIVDLLRNDLSRVCEPGSIRVSQLCGVETYETVQHLVSVIGGHLANDRGACDLLAASFPGGSITGAPKIRAMEIIAEMEPTVRGPYCGSLFYLGLSGQFDSSILIRTFVCCGGWIQCGVGGGVTVQSDPEAEYRETLHKAEGMLRALP